MIRLFLFGTLLDDGLRAVLACPGPGVSARLTDHAVEQMSGSIQPVCTPRPGRTAEGALVEDVDAGCLVRLDYYEAVLGRTRRPVRVESRGKAIEAEAYIQDPDPAASGEPWRLADWQHTAAALACAVASQLMDELHAGTPPAEAAGKWVVLAARAQAGLAARNRPGPHREDAPAAMQIEDCKTRTVYSKFFRVDERDLKVPTFAGGAPPEIERAVLLAVDAVTVLPYDPARDRVLLVEQFRIGPHARGDVAPWLLEAIAGRVDGGESWEATAHREAREEAGLDLASLHKVAEFYPSPGALSEFIIAYVALADLPDGIAGVHGLASEHEDIRTHLVDYAAFLDLMDAGHVRNGPLLISAQWLAVNRGRLRGLVNGA